MNFKRLGAAILSGIMSLSMIAAPSDFSLKDIGSQNVIVADAAQVSTMRRPCDPDHPMLIVHIDTWNVADPAKIIALIPEDIKPYCVFNISLSINWSNDTHEWLMVQNGYECAKSWLKTCSDEGVWCMVQPASGGQCHLPDYDSNYNIVQSPNKSLFVQKADEDYENTIYAEFFRDYPSFIGFNYSEQFWGFDSKDHPCTYQQRYAHFAHLLKLCNKYGGYLNINWCANRWSAPLNPIAMLKTNSEWRSACEKYGQNLQIEEKYTQGSFIADVESEVLGFYLAGYCGNFGVRYDETGWSDGTENKDYYHQITGMPIHLERMALNGATVIDGPELVWADDFKETWGGIKDSEGYSCRNWETRDQYVNTTLDFFRKVIDGSIRIPTRQEVIDRTKVVVIQDVSSGDDHAKYSTYPSLFEGLYRMNGDGNLWDNTNPYKSTGRYPTIPTVYGLRDDIAKSFQVQIKQSQIASRWSTISAKQDEFNKLFPAEYYGNCYAARYENTWVTYNPNKKGDNCGAVLSLKYNTCKELDVNFNANGNALINEYSDHIDIYTCNFNEDIQSTLVTDTFKISGCSSKPSYTAKDTGRNQTKSQISESYDNGTYTLTVKHNGPVDISVKCSGNESGRLTSYKKSTISAPASAPFYTGIRQYEGEFFDVKNTEGYVQNACRSGVTGVQGQGFLKFGKNANTSVKDTVRTQKDGKFKLTLRYSATADINCVDLYVNGSKVKTLSLPKGSSYSDWKTVSENIDLKAGDNKIEFKANAALPVSLYIDNFTVEGNFGDGTPVTIPEPEPLNGKLIKNLVVADKENASDWSIQDNFKVGTAVYGDRDFTATAVPSHISGAEFIRTACDSKLTTSDEAAFTAGGDISVYVALDTRVNTSAAPWINDWTKTDSVVKTSNDVTFAVYKKNVKSGENVTLGTNSGNGDTANYIVIVTEQQDEPVVKGVIKGDIDGDGVIDAFDMVFARRGILNGFASADAEDAADVDNNGSVEVADLVQLEGFLLGRIKAFTEAEKKIISPEVYMSEISAKILNSEPSDATAENAGTAYGTYEKVTIDSAVCGRKKSFNVLLPAGYSTDKKYPVMYVLHGYWG